MPNPTPPERSPALRVLDEAVKNAERLLFDASKKRDSCLARVVELKATRDDVERAERSTPDAEEARHD